MKTYIRVIRVIQYDVLNKNTKDLTGHMLKLKQPQIHQRNILVHDVKQPSHDQTTTVSTITAITVASTILELMANS